MTAPNRLPCGAPYALPFEDENGRIVYPCNCYWCARCGGHAGGQYGHFSILCKVFGGVVDKQHFCCPDDCELHDELRAGSKALLKLAREKSHQRAMGRLVEQYGGETA